MELQGHFKSWDDFFSKCFSDLKEKYPKFNDAQIADKLSIPRATFNRIKNESKLPRIDNIIKLVIGSGNMDFLSDVISLKDRKLADTIKNVMAISLEEKNKILVDDELESLLEDRDVFVAYMLAGLKSGVDKIRLVQVLGNQGLDAIEKLSRKNIVSFDGNAYKLARQGVLVRSFQSIKHHLSTYARFYHPEHVGQGRNYNHSYSDGLNLSGLKKLQEIHQRYHKEIAELFRDEQFEGDIPSFSVGFCDSFTKMDQDQLQQKGEQ